MSVAVLKRGVIAAVAVGLGLAGVLPALADEPLRVEFITVAPRATEIDIELTGTLEALDSVELGFRQGGRIIEVNVNEGDRFAEGDVLARIDPLQLEQALNAATAALSAARAAEDQARQAAERAEALLERGVGTRAARDEARQQLSAAETQREQAESVLDQARRSVADTELRAPFTGVVTDRRGEPGQVVGPAQTVLSLASASGIEAVFMAADMQALHGAMGKEVALSTIEVDAPPMRGHVTEISPMIDPVTGSVRLRALVNDAPRDTSLLGAAVRGRVTLSTGEAVEIPWTALSSGGGSPAVWVVEDGRVHLRPVRIERFDDENLLLSEGVSAGEIVVGLGSQKLFEGRDVIPVGDE